VVEYLSSKKGLAVPDAAAAAALARAEEELPRPAAPMTSVEFRTAVCRHAMGILVKAEHAKAKAPRAPSAGAGVEDTASIIRSYEAERESGQAAPRELPPELAAGAGPSPATRGGHGDEAAAVFVLRSWDARAGRGAAGGTTAAFHNPVRAAQNFLCEILVPAALAGHTPLVSAHVRFGAGAVARSWTLLPRGGGNAACPWVAFSPAGGGAIDVTGWATIEVRDFAGATIGPTAPVLELPPGGDGGGGTVTATLRLPGGGHALARWLTAAPETEVRVQARGGRAAAAGASAVRLAPVAASAASAAMPSDDTVRARVLGGRVPGGETSFWVTDLGMIAVMSRMSRMSRSPRSPGP